MKLDRFINRPVLSTVISIFMVILGVIGLLFLPITRYPDIAPPTIQVSTTYTGANAQTILNSVIAPLEESKNGVENMLYMTSTATNTGSASINVYFKQGTDPDMAAVNVQNRVAKAQNLFFRCKVKDDSHVKANDDAAECMWIPLKEIKTELFGLSSIRSGLIDFIKKNNTYL